MNKLGSLTGSVPSYFGFAKYAITSVWGWIAIALMITAVIILILILFGSLSWWWLLAWFVIGPLIALFGAITAASYGSDLANNMSDNINTGIQQVQGIAQQQVQQGMNMAQGIAQQQMQQGMNKRFPNFQQPGAMLRIPQQYTTARQQILPPQPPGVVRPPASSIPPQQPSNKFYGNDPRYGNVVAPFNNILNR